MAHLCCERPHGRKKNESVGETNGVTTQTRDPADHQEPSRQSKPEATGGGGRGALMGAEASSIQGVGAD